MSKRTSKYWMLFYFYNCHFCLFELFHMSTLITRKRNIILKKKKLEWFCCSLYRKLVVTIFRYFIHTHSLIHGQAFIYWIFLRKVLLCIAASDFPTRKWKKLLSILIIFIVNKKFQIFYKTSYKFRNRAHLKFFTK